MAAINQTIQYENDNFNLVINAPTMANCQALMDYGREQYLKISSVDQNDPAACVEATMPKFADLARAIEIMGPFIVSLKDKEGNDVPTDNMAAAGFLNSIMMLVYHDVFEQSAIKKK